ncbi:MAG: hypothetical protein ACRCVI_02105 [Mycoplasmoidaceae bacterium]
MYSDELIQEIIKSDLSIIPGISKKPSRKDIVVDHNLINIKVKLMDSINIKETAKLILTQLRFMLIDKTNNKDFKINLIIYI